MQIACTSDGKSYSLLLKAQQEIEKLRGHTFHCPACKETVTLKNGQIKMPHFSHKKGTLCKALKGGETTEHIQLKAVIAQWCQQQNLAYQVEAYLPKLKQRPDILIADKYAIEIQCTPLSVARLAERTRNYLAHGYQPIWLCGSRLWSHDTLSDVTKNFCGYSKRLGVYLWCMDSEKQTLFLQYHLEEDGLGGLYAAKKSWRFYQHSLLSILTFPQHAKIFHQRVYSFSELGIKYYAALTKQFYQREERIRKIQAHFYLTGMHVLELPVWFYYSGLSLFGCKQTDLLFKQKIFLQLMQMETITLPVFLSLIEAEVLGDRQFLHPLPLWTDEQSLQFYFRILFISLWRCGHLQNVGDQWRINRKVQRVSAAKLSQQLDKMKNLRIITAIPHKSMIR